MALCICWREPSEDAVFWRLERRWGFEPKLESRRRLEFGGMDRSERLGPFVCRRTTGLALSSAFRARDTDVARREAAEEPVEAAKEEYDSSEGE